MLYSPFAIAAPLPEPTAAEFIYTGSSNGITTKFDANTGESLLSVDHGNDVNGIAVDQNGNFYTGGNALGNGITTRKYDSSGTLLLSINPGNNSHITNGIAVDQNGNFYTVGNRPFPTTVTTRKYDSSGNLLLSVDHGATVFGITVDADGNFYTVGDGTSNIRIRKYDSAGNLIFSTTSTRNVQNNAIAIDSIDNVLIGTDLVNQAGPESIEKFNPDGNTLFLMVFGQTVRAVAADIDNNIYAGGLRNSAIGGTNATTRKYDSSGNLLLSVDHGATVFGITVDKDDNIYTGGIRTSLGPGTNITTRKYDSSGNLLLSVDHGSFVNAIDIFPPNKGAFLS